MGAVEILLIVLAAAAAFAVGWLLAAGRRGRGDLELLERIEQRFAGHADTLRENVAAQAEGLRERQEAARQAEQELIDQKLKGHEGLIEARLKSVDELMKTVGQRLEKLGQDNRGAYEKLGEQLEQAARVTRELSESTGSLREALSSSQRRGQWGERMAEDILRLAGLQEGVNYRKQKTMDTSARRPDYSFLLPENRCLNMDVKFPLDNYLRWLDADTDGARDRAQKAFLADVRGQIKAVAGRDYIDPGSGTLDYVLLFIPNEQIYGFLHEQAPELMDEALKKKVVLCSPLTLYAMLAVIRQSMQNYVFSQSTRKILDFMADFGKQWDMFVAQMEKVGRRFDDVHRDYQTLETTRTRMLQRQVDRIDELRAAEGMDDALPEGRRIEAGETGEAGAGK